MRQASGLEFAQTLTDLVCHGDDVFDVPAGKLDVNHQRPRPRKAEVTYVEETFAIATVDEILDAVVLDVLVVDGVLHGLVGIQSAAFNMFSTEFFQPFFGIFFGVLPPTILRAT